MLSKHKFPGTIVYAALSGEEQGLYGGKILAEYAKTQGWNVIANLNNDIIGNSCSSDGRVRRQARARLFRRAAVAGRHELRGAGRSLGGENDAPSRNISRCLDTPRRPARTSASTCASLAQRPLRPRRRPYRVPQCRLSRGAPFGRGRELRLAAPGRAGREWHQYGDTIDHMDFPYLEKVTKLNVAALAALASAPPPPEPTVEGAVRTDTTLTWDAVPRAASYIVRWRRTDANEWRAKLCVSADRRVRTASDQSSIREKLDPVEHHAASALRAGGAPRHPRRRLGVRRLIGQQRRFRKPGRLGGAGRGFKPYVAPPPNRSRPAPMHHAEERRRDAAIRAQRTLGSRMAISFACAMTA